MGLTVDDIKYRLEGAWESLAVVLLGKPTSRTRSELRFGRKGSISVQLSGPKAGRWFDHEELVGGGPYQLIEREIGCDFKGALEWAKDWLGLEADFKPDPIKLDEIKRQREKREAQHEKKVEADKKQRIAYAGSLYSQSVPVTGTDGEAYLKGRCIEGPFPDCVRYVSNPSALLLVATNPNGKGQAVQRVLLNGDKKADVTNQKRTNGVTANAAIRLPGEGTILYMCEGPETALSVWKATRAPTWAVMGQFFAKHEIPEGIEQIVIAHDNEAPDSPAFKMAEKAQLHYVQRGYECHVVRPEGELKIDFNDIHQIQGLDAVLRMLAIISTVAKTPYSLPINTADQSRDNLATFVKSHAVKIEPFHRSKREHHEYLAAMKDANGEKTAYSSS